MNPLTLFWWRSVALNSSKRSPTFRSLLKWYYEVVSEIIHVLADSQSQVSWTDNRQCSTSLGLWVQNEETQINRVKISILERQIKFVLEVTALQSIEFVSCWAHVPRGECVLVEHSVCKQRSFSCVSKLLLAVCAVFCPSVYVR